MTMMKMMTTRMMMKMIQMKMTMCLLVKDDRFDRLSVKPSHIVLFVVFYRNVFCF